MIICPNLLVGYYWGSTARFIGVFIVNHHRDDIYYITKQIQIVHWDGMIGMGVYFMAHTTYQGIRAYQGAICICALSELLMSLVCAKESFWNSGLACCSARHIIKQYISSTGIDTYIHIIHSYVSYVYMRICRSLTLNSGSHTHTPSFSLIFCCLLWLRQSGRQLGELLWCLPFAALRHGPVTLLFFPQLSQTMDRWIV